MARATDVQTASSHSYNPFDGPNENPEAELPLTAGKYLYVYGDMDEDGFYEGLWLCCRWWALACSRQKTSLPGPWEMRQVPSCPWLLALCSVPPYPQRSQSPSVMIARTVELAFQVLMAIDGWHLGALSVHLGRAPGQLRADTDADRCFAVTSHYLWGTGRHSTSRMLESFLKS